VTLLTLADTSRFGSILAILALMAGAGILYGGCSRSSSGTAADLVPM
jgi:hypothetical protein